MSTIIEDAAVTTVDATASTAATTATAATTTAVTDWRSSLPDELKADPSLSTFKDIGSLAKSYVETKKLVGIKGELKVPGEAATPEEKAAFDAAIRKSTGVPDSPAGYEIKRPEIALTVGWSDENETAFKAMAHEIGLTPKQAQKIVEFQGARLAQEHSAVTRAREAVKGELRTEWGGEYPQRLGRANRALTQYGGNDLIDLLAKPSMTPLGDHPVVIRAFAKIADDLIEHGAIEPTGPEALTSDQATEKITELRESLLKAPAGSVQAKQITEQIIALTRRLTPRG